MSPIPPMSQFTPTTDIEPSTVLGLEAAPEPTTEAPADYGQQGQSSAKLEALRIEFGSWLVSPDRQGTQREWAAAHGISDPGTLSHWKKRPEVMAVIAAWREDYRLSFSDVVLAIHRKAIGASTRGDVQAARLLGDWLGENAPQQIESTINQNVTYAEPGSLKRVALTVLGGGPPKVLDGRAPAGRTSSQSDAEAPGGVVSSREAS